MRFLHPIVVVAISIGAAALAAVVGNDYYLRIGFMMCVYYLCAAGMNVLVGYAGQNHSGRPDCLRPALTARHCYQRVSI